jgi:uncharacterized membrane protein HdeD (DUF308 family)
MRSRTMPMSQSSRSVPWWALLLPGFAAVIVGVLIVSPSTRQETVTGLFQVLGLACIAGGMAALISLAFNRVMWGYKLFGGLAAILIGLALFRNALLSAYIFAAAALWILGVGVLLGGFALVIGGLAYASWTPTARAKAWLIAGSGVICLIAGFGIVLGSATGPLKAPWLYGIVVILAGVGAIAGGLNMRRRA